MKIVTDSKQPDEPKNADESIIYQLYCHFANDAEKAEMRRGFEEGGMGYGDAKQQLFEAIERDLEEPSKLYNELLADRPKIDKWLEEGAEKARETAQKTLHDMRHVIGLS